MTDGVMLLTLLSSYVTMCYALFIATVLHVYEAWLIVSKGVFSHGRMCDQLLPSSAAECRQ
jgi:hypothetical protein